MKLTIIMALSIGLTTQIALAAEPGFEKTDSEMTSQSPGFEKQKRGAAGVDEKYLDQERMEQEAKTNSGKEKEKSKAYQREVQEKRNIDPALYDTNVPTWK